MDTCASARQTMLIMDAIDTVASGHLSGGSTGCKGGSTVSAKCWKTPAALLNRVADSTISVENKVFTVDQKLPGDCKC
jgi:hypothetical protein